MPTITTKLLKQTGKFPERIKAKSGRRSLVVPMVVLRRVYGAAPLWQLEAFVAEQLRVKISNL